MEKISVRPTGNCPHVQPHPTPKVSELGYIYISAKTCCFCPCHLLFFSIIQNQNQKTFNVPQTGFVTAATEYYKKKNIYLNNYYIKEFRFRSSALRVLLKLLSPPEFIQRTNYRRLFFSFHCSTSISSISLLNNQ